MAVRNAHVGDIVHYVPEATHTADRCCAALVCRVNTGATLDLVMFDSEVFDSVPGEFVLGKPGGYPPEPGKWHWPEPQRGDFVWYVCDEGTYLAVVELALPTEGLILTVPNPGPGLGPGTYSGVPYAAKPEGGRQSWHFLREQE